MTRATTTRYRLLAGSAVLLASLTWTGAARAAGPIVMMIGPPGSGRSTQAQILKKDRGMAVISVDTLVAQNPDAFKKAKAAGENDFDVRLDPAMNQLVEDALTKADLGRGVVLDGYPASKAQGDFLETLRTRMGLPKAIVIHLVASDSVVRKRLKSQKRPNLDQELKDYHRELDFARVYFPEADIRDVDATKKPDDVAKEIRKILDELPK